jgi:hypothetical protein
VLGQSFSTPLAGVGVLLGALALFLLMTGMIAELVYRTSDLREQRLSVLTAEQVGFGTSAASRSAPAGGGLAMRAKVELCSKSKYRSLCRSASGSTAWRICMRPIGAGSMPAA